MPLDLPDKFRPGSDPVFEAYNTSRPPLLQNWDETQVADVLSFADTLIRSANLLPDATDFIQEAEELIFERNQPRSYNDVDAYSRMLAHEDKRQKTRKAETASLLLAGALPVKYLDEKFLNMVHQLEDIESKTRVLALLNQRVEETSMRTRIQPEILSLSWKIRRAEKSGPIIGSLFSQPLADKSLLYQSWSSSLQEVAADYQRHVYEYIDFSVPFLKNISPDKTLQQIPELLQKTAKEWGGRKEENRPDQGREKSIPRIRLPRRTGNGARRCFDRILPCTQRKNVRSPTAL